MSNWTIIRTSLPTYITSSLGQCTTTLEDRIKSRVDYTAASQDGVQLLQIIKQLTYSFEDCKKLFDAPCDVKEGIYQMRQGEYESLQDFYEQFKNHVNMMDEVGAIFADNSLVGEVTMMNGQTHANGQENGKRPSNHHSLHTRY